MSSWLDRAFGLGLFAFKKLAIFLITIIPEFPQKEVVVLLILATVAVVAVWLLAHLITALIRLLLPGDPNTKGEKLFAKGKYERAAHYYLRGDNPLKVAQCFLKLGKALEAAKYFEAGKEVDMAARCYAQEGQFVAAAKLFESSGRLLDAAEKYELGGEYLASATLYRQLRYLKKAEEMFLKTDGFNRIAEMYLAEYQTELKRAAETSNSKMQERRLVYLRELTKKAGEYCAKAGDYAAAAKVYLEGGHKGEAGEALAAMGKQDQAAPLFLSAGRTLRAAQAFEAAAMYQEALNLYEELDEHEAAPRVLEKMGRRREAAEYRANIELKRGQKINAAQSFVQAGKLREAAQLLAEAKSFREAAVLLVQIADHAGAADLLVKAGDLEGAAVQFEAARRFTSAANCYLQLNQTDKYVDTLERGGAYLEAGLYLETRDEGRAIAILQKIDSDSPDYRFACNLLGRIFLHKQMDNLATEKIELAVKDLEVDRTNLDFFNDLARLRERQGRVAEAIKIYDKILALDFHYKELRSYREELAKRPPSQMANSAAFVTGSQTMPLPPANSEARMINQRYEVRREVGRGGMGVVLEAYDKMLHRAVALKFLPAVVTPTSTDVEKFLNEARSAARLNHPNIVTIYDVQLEEGSNNYFIVMEYVDGVNLKEIVEASHHLPFTSIHMILRQVCDALAYAHQRSVIHRDIKSANLIWTNDKVVKVTDFGLAKILENSQNASTRALGSPAYMSPEQVLGKPVDQRSDIYSLGISLYEMVTGKVPFDRGDIGYHQVHTPPEPAESTRTDLPTLLGGIIRKCIEKKPEDRFQNVLEIKTELERAPLEQAIG